MRQQTGHNLDAGMTNEAFGWCVRSIYCHLAVTGGIYESWIQFPVWTQMSVFTVLGWMVGADSWRVGSCYSAGRKSATRALEQRQEVTSFHGPCQHSPGDVKPSLQASLRWHSTNPQETINLTETLLSRKTSQLVQRGDYVIIWGIMFWVFTKCPNGHCVELVRPTINNVGHRESTNQLFMRSHTFKFLDIVFKKKKKEIK